MTELEQIVQEHVNWAIRTGKNSLHRRVLCGVYSYTIHSRRDLEYHIRKLYRSLIQEEEMTEDTKGLCKWAFEAYNELAKDIGIPLARAFTDRRYKHMRARFQEISDAKENPKEIWELALKYLEESAFCRGANERGWKADLDFILQPSSFWRLVEGRYSNGHNETQPPSGKSSAEIFAERYAGRY